MSQYPEHPPEDLNPIAPSKFIFWTDASERARKESKAKLERIEERIETISNNCMVTSAATGGRGTIIDKILAITHSREELLNLAAGLQRVAALMDMYTDIEKRVKVLDLAEDDPAWFKLAFGNFSDDIDTDLKQLEALGQNES